MSEPVGRVDPFVCVGDTKVREVSVAVSAIERAVRPCSPLLVLYFVGWEDGFGALTEAMQRRFPDALTAGCTTMGEIGPSGCIEGALSALAIGPPARVAAELVQDLGTMRFEDGRALVARLARALDLSPADLSASRHVFITLADGLCGVEERLLAAIGSAAPGVPLVGGSAGDGPRFQETLVALNGVAATGAAVVLLLEPASSFHAFQLSHLRPTCMRLVVTEAEPSRRLVRELNGRPALDVLSSISGLNAAELRARLPDGLVDAPIHFGYRVGSEHYNRTVMTIQGDALLLGGAVEEGAVLTLMQAGDLVAETREGVQRAMAALPGLPAALLLFNCGARLFEAQQIGAVQALGEAMCPLPAAGFTTYGEQYGPMQVNSTLTGLVLGWPDGR